MGTTTALDHKLDSEDALNRRVVETAVMRALFPNDTTRRRFLHAVGSSTAMHSEGHVEHPYVRY